MNVYFPEDRTGIPTYPTTPLYPTYPSNPWERGSWEDCGRCGGSGKVFIYPHQYDPWRDPYYNYPNRVTCYV